jgi:hypothetical protein
MKKYLFLFSFLLIGIGCTQAPPETKLVAEPVAPIVQKPIEPDPLDIMYKFCEDNGNRIVVQFDAESKTSRPFCLFSNHTQCDASAYMKGSCGPNNGAKIFANTNNDVTALLRTCTDADPVVCGEDGRNYTNRCVAELQHITSKHSGVCTAEEQIEILVPNDAAPIDPIQEDMPIQKDAQGNILPPKSKTAPASWLPLLYQMIESYGKQSPRSFVEECLINGQTLYYYEQGGPSRFSVLYNDSGTVSCFPRNDITASCPSIITSGQRGCKQIWRDNR